MTRRREFSRGTMLRSWDRCEGPDGVHRCECDDCGGLDNTIGLPINPGDGPEYHHHVEAELGGDNSLVNCRCLRRSCHARITATETAPKIAKSRSVRAAHAGIKPKSKWKRRLPFGKDDPRKAKVGGGWEWRG